MKYLVILDAHSIVGSAYAGGDNDGFAGEHPALRCLQVDTSDSHYLYCVREAMQGRVKAQRLRIPHQAVAYVFEYGPAEAFPFGFVPARTQPEPDSDVQAIAKDG